MLTLLLLDSCPTSDATLTNETSLMKLKRDVFDEDSYRSLAVRIRMAPSVVLSKWFEHNVLIFSLALETVMKPLLISSTQIEV